MGGGKYLRRDMTEAEKVEARRAAKAQQYRRSIGRGDRCTAEETARALAHVRRLRDRFGMTTEQLRTATGMSISTLNDYYRGFRSGAGRQGQPVQAIPRRKYEAVMRVRPEAPEGRGALVSVLGAQRRVQALLCAGYGFPVQCELIGWAQFQRVWKIANDAPDRKVSWQTHWEIDQVFQKYAHVDAREALGLSNYAWARAHNTAERHGYAPAMCWDEDTLDDPDAIPEWTGACGTVSGYYLHRKHGILVGPHGEVTCDPCREARTRQQTEQRRERKA